VASAWLALSGQYCTSEAENGENLADFSVKVWIIMNLQPLTTQSTLTAHAFYHWFTAAPLHIIGIIVIALTVQFIGGRAIMRAIRKIAEAPLVPGRKRSLNRQKERAATTGSLLRSILIGLIWVVAIAMILSEFGFNLGPILASASVLGVALGLGAQTLVRDILAGIFMLVEDQYGVGDEIEALEVSGVVESVGLRITSLRAQDGTLWYLRNGEILKIGNRSQH
jgi:small-conductance mechanosensitive channel